jgi:nucleotide-binding universal stress UspA family protein
MPLGQPTRPILIAVAGSEPAEFWEAVRALLPAGSVELFHVVDEGPRQELEMQFGRHPGLPRPPHLAEATSAAERRGSEAILAEAVEALGERAREASSSTATGRPELEIERRAVEIRAGLVVVAARTRSGPVAPGPHSVGHVARHVSDHAPCPVLMVRLRG